MPNSLSQFGKKIFQTTLGVVLTLSALVGIGEWVAHAATPPLMITYQGKVLVSGAPATTSLNMSFVIYNSVSGGTALYSASGTLSTPLEVNVTPSNGLFSVNLGDTTAAPITNVLDPDIFKNNTNLFLQVTINGQTLSPRKRITASPYAFNALYAATSTYAENAGTSTYASTAGSANTANTSNYANNAGTSTYATNAASALTAVTSTYADLAGNSNLFAGLSTSSFLMPGNDASITGVWSFLSDLTISSTSIGQANITNLRVIGNSYGLQLADINGSSTLIYNTGTYADPAWLTSLAASKIVGTVGSALIANTSTYSYNAGTSTYAYFAGTSTYANIAGSALTAVTATYALNASTSNYANNSGKLEGYGANDFLASSTMALGVTGYMAYYPADGRNIAATNTIYISGGRIGLGTTALDASLAKVTIGGDIFAQNTSGAQLRWNSQGLLLRSPTGTLPRLDLRNDNNEFDFRIQLAGTKGLELFSGPSSTNQVSRLKIDDNGLVGINNSSPNYTLDVDGDINLTGALRVNNIDYSSYFIDGVGSNGQVWTSDGSGRGYWYTLPSASQASGVGTSTANLFAVYNGASTVTGTNELYLDGSYIGVGTTTPHYKLDVSGDLNISGAVRIGGADYSQYFINATGTLGQFWSSNGTGNSRGSWVNSPVNSGLIGQIAYYAAGGGTVSGTSTIYVYNGKIGIGGNTNPNYALDVSGAINSTGGYLINGVNYSQYFIDSAGSAGQVWVSSGTGRGYWYTLPSGSGYGVGTSTVGYMAVYSSDNVVTGTGAMMVSGTAILISTSGIYSASGNPAALTIGGALYADTLYASGNGIFMDNNKIIGIDSGILNVYGANNQSMQLQTYGSGNLSLVSNSTGQMLLQTGSGLMRLFSNTGGISVSTTNSAITVAVGGNNALTLRALQGSITISAPTITVSGTISGAATWHGNTIAVGYGGTGATTFASNGLLVGHGTSAVGTITVPTTTSFLYWNGASYDWTPIEQLSTLTGSVNSSTQGYVAYYDSSGNNLSGTSTVFIQNGRVGIGTVSPTGTLEVSANSLNTVGHLVVNRGNNGGLGGQLTLRNNSAGGSGTSAALAFELDGTTAFGSDGSDQANAQIRAQVTGASDKSTAIIFDTWNGSTSAERMRINANGNVGIGTTGGVYALTVNGDLNLTTSTAGASSTLRINGVDVGQYFINGAGVSGQVWASLGSGRGYWADISSLPIAGAVGTSTAGNIAWYDTTGANVTGTANIFIDPATGYFGVNNTAPATRMQIKGADNKDSGPILSLVGNAPNQFEGGRIRFLEDQSQGYLGAYIQYNASGDVLNIGVHAAADSATSSDTNAISVLRSNGYVGIGNSNPTYKFDVSGDVNIGGAGVLRLGGTNYSQYFISSAGVYGQVWTSDGSGAGWWSDPSIIESDPIFMAASSSFSRTTHNHAGVYEPAFSVLTIGKGGTGTSTISSNVGSLLYSNGTSYQFTNAATANYVLMSQGGVPTWVTTSTLGIVVGAGSGTINSGTAGQVAYYATNGTAVSGTSSLFIATNGYVGVGTSTPPSTLTVSGTLNVLVGGATYTMSNSSNIAGWFNVMNSTLNDYATVSMFHHQVNSTPANGFGTKIGLAGTGYDGVQDYTMGQIGAVWQSASNYYGQLQFFTRNGVDFTGTNSHIPKMVISGYSGNVGIGTTTPDYKLTTAVSADYDGIVLKDTVNKLLFAVVKEGNAGYFNLYDNGVKKIMLHPAANSYYNGSGNFGIGTTTPGALLDIGGGVVNTSISNARLLITANADEASGVQMYNSSAGTAADFRFSVINNNQNEYLAFATPGDGNTASLFGLTRSTANYIFNNAFGAGVSRHLAIGTVRNGDLVFAASSTERMRIANTGYIGIGTTTPNSLLSLYGGANDTRIKMNFVPTGNMYNGLELQKNGIFKGGIFYSNTRDVLELWGSQARMLSVSSTNISLLGSGVERLTVNSSGNVGVGTTTPTYQLDVIASSTANPLRIGSTVTSSILVVNSSGHVGIGTSSPRYQLHIVNSAPREQAVYYQNLHNSYRSMIVADASTDGLGANGSRIDFRAHPTGYSETLFGTTMAGKSALISISTNGLIVGEYNDQPVIFGTNNKERMRIANTGNVGISTTSPNYPLTVNGDINITSSTGGIPALRINGTDMSQYFITSAGTAGQIWQSDGTGAGEWVNTSTLGIVGGGITSESDPIFMAASSSFASSTHNHDGTYEPAFSILTIIKGGTGTSTISSNVGSLLYSDGSAYQFTNASTDNYVLMSQGGVPTWVTTSTLGLVAGIGSGTVNIGTAGQIAYYATDGAAVSGTSSLFVAANGYVGIGTTTPRYSVDAGTGTISALRFRVDSKAMAYWDTAAPNLPSAYPSGTLVLGFAGTVGSAAFPSRLNAYSTSYLETYYNSGNPYFAFIGGNVGVGTTSPSASLSVIAATSTGSIFQVGTTTAQNILTVLANGHVGIGSSTPNSPLVLQYSKSGFGLTIANSLATNYSLMRFLGTGRSYTIGVGNASETSYGLANKWFVFDATSNTARMVVDSVGNIGIGTTTPDASLSIYTTTGAAGIILSDFNSSEGGALSIYDGATSGFLPTIKGQSNGVGGYGVALYGVIPPANDVVNVGGGGVLIRALRSDNTVLQNANVLSVNNYTTNLMTVMANGYVGIGTTTPGSLLDIYGNSTNAVMRILSGNTSNYSYITMGRASVEMSMGVAAAADNGLVGTVAGDVWLKNVNTANKLSIGIGSGAPAITVASSSYIGIGTTTPNYRFTIAGTFTGNDRTAINLANYSTNSDAAISIRFQSGTSTGFIGAYDAAYASLPGLGNTFGVNAVGNATTSLFLMSGSASGVMRFYTGGNNERMRIDSAGNVGIGTTTPAYKFQVYIDASNEGHVSATGDWARTSDSRLKKNVNTLTSALQIIGALRPISYDPITGSNTASGTSLGFLAQEVEPLVPQAVDTNSITGYKSVAYGQFIPILTAAIKEQQAQIDALTIGLANKSTSTLSELTLNSSITGFTNKIDFKNHVSFDADTVGRASILSGATSTRVIFTKPYDELPVITVTAI